MSKGFACRDCAQCTGHAFTAMGKKTGRASADIMTLGVTALARKKCRGCGHPMADHEGKRGEVVQTAAPVEPGPQGPPMPDALDARIGSIVQMAQLHDRGVLDDAAFVSEVKRILRGE